MVRLTRRGLLQATAALAAPAIVRAQGGDAASRRADAAHRRRQLRRSAHAEGDAGGGERHQRRGRSAGTQDRTGGRGRRDQSRSGGARGAQAGQCGQGAGDHGDLGIGGHHRGRAGVLGEQDLPHHRVRCGFHHASAASGLSDPHPAEQSAAGDEACGVHHPAWLEARVHPGDPGAVRRADAEVPDRDADAEGRDGRRAR